MNLTSLVLIVAGVGIVASAWRFDPVAPHASPPRLALAKGSTSPAPSPLAHSISADAWTRRLRQPLYDPPPPPPPAVVAEAPRPIPVRLVGTVIEPGNSQAFVRQASGTVELKRIGDQVTPDPADGVIADITTSDLVIHRKDGDHRVAVEDP